MGDLSAMVDAEIMNIVYVRNANQKRAVSSPSSRISITEHLILRREGYPVDMPVDAPKFVFVVFIPAHEIEHFDAMLV